MTSNIPKAFVSYSHDSQDHKKWVLELATRLRNNGIDAILDQFELQAGDDVPHFMETHLSSSKKILMVCTEKYVEKANKGEGGVGYEKMIITSNLMRKIDENKIIPIIRQVGSSDVPTFLKSKLYINFSKQDDYEYNYDDLVRTIHNRPLFVKPPVGNSPFTPIAKEKLSGDTDLLNNVLCTIAQQQRNGYSAVSTEIAQKLNISFILFKVAAIKLIGLKYAEWSKYTGYAEHDYISITEKGMLYAYENGLLK